MRYVVSDDDGVVSGNRIEARPMSLTWSLELGHQLVPPGGSSPATIRLKPYLAPCEVPAQNAGSGLGLFLNPDTNGADSREHGSIPDTLISWLIRRDP